MAKARQKKSTEGQPSNETRREEIAAAIEQKKKEMQELEEEQAKLESKSSEESEESKDSKDSSTSTAMSPETNLMAALTLCGLNEEQKKALIDEGYDKMSQLVWLKPDSIKNLLSSIAKKSAKVEFKHIQQSTIRALVMWAHDQNKMDNDLDSQTFRKDTLDEYRERDQLVDDEVEITFDASFEPNKWVSWSRDFMAFLWGTKGSNGIPLAYVVVDKEPSKVPNPKPQDYDLVYKAKKRGEAYQKDNKRVWSILQQHLTSKNGGWAWISKHSSSQNGRSAWKSLTEHYEGIANKEARANICDDPFDPHRKLGISFDDDAVPLLYQQNVVFVTTRAPTYDELQDGSLTRYVMTDSKPWIPSTMARPKSKEEEEYERLVANVRIDSLTVSATTQMDPILAYDDDNNDYDSLLSTCSAIYTDRCLLQRLIVTQSVGLMIDVVVVVDYISPRGVDD